MSLTFAGLMVRPVGCVFTGSMVQLPSEEPDSVYLKTLSVVLSSTTQMDVPSVTMPLPLVLALFRLKLLAALWLPERRPAAPVYLKTLPCLLSTSQMSVPLVAMPSNWAEGLRPPAVQEPSRPPLVL